MIKHFKINVYGRVQGVGFRYSASSVAKSLGLQGWVENRPDGSVFAVAQGEQTSCQAFLEWCQEGPSFSRVKKVEVQEYPPVDMGDFSIRY